MAVPFKVRPTGTATNVRGSNTPTVRGAGVATTFVGNPAALRRTKRLTQQPTAARHDQPVPPQAAPNTNQPVKVGGSIQTRALRGTRLARSRIAAVAPEQPAVTPTRQRPTLRRLRPVRGRHAAITPAQVPPVPTAHQTPRRLWGAPRGRHRNVIPPQFNPPPTASQRRAYRVAVARKGRRAEAPATQQAAPVNPVFVAGRNQARALRGWLVRHGRQSTPTPAQQAVVAPVKVWQTRPKRLRYGTTRRKTVTAPVGQQPTVIAQPHRRTAASPVLSRRRALLNFAVQIITAVQLRGSDRRGIVLTAVSTDNDRPSGTDQHNAHATGTADHDGRLTGKDA